MNKTILSAISLIFFGLFSVSSGATYYVDAVAGNDGAAGTSQSAAWKTLTNVNAKDFSAGDNILLKGGSQYTGPLNLAETDGGTSSMPLTISSYGTGRATIKSSSSNQGIYGVNVGGLVIKNLNFIGGGRKIGTNIATDGKNGILLKVNKRVNYLRIDSVEISEYNWDGILVTADNDFVGYNDVRITNAVAHDCGGKAGIYVYAPSSNCHSNVYIGYCKVYNIFGNNDLTTLCGSGILVCVNKGTIEYCVAYNCGGENPYDPAGPCGIWCFNTDSLIIQYCESYLHKAGRNKAGVYMSHDGAGFDLDRSTTNSIMQYNYAHDNEGAGFLLCQVSGRPAWGNNICRYNISENDGKRNNYGGIHITGGSDDMQVYNNVVYISPAVAGLPAALKSKYSVTKTYIHNNILIASGGVPLVNGLTTSAGVFQNNAYYAVNGGFKITWGTTNYASLDAWRTASGREKLNGASVGFSGDPKLTSYGTTGTIGDPTRLRSITGYKLQSTSPMINKGVSIAAMYSKNPGTKDFWGNSIPNGTSFDIGAHEYGGTTAVGFAAQETMQNRLPSTGLTAYNLKGARMPASRNAAGLVLHTRSNRVSGQSVMLK